MPDRYYSTLRYNFVWDDDKNAENYRKHAITFETAALVFNDDLRLEFPDSGHSYDEERYNTIGLVYDVLFVVYCDRENTRSGVDDIRIISARPATKHEIEAYNNNIRGRY